MLAAQRQLRSSTFTPCESLTSLTQRRCAGSRPAVAPLKVEARVTTPRDRRKKRHMSIRRKVVGNPSRPRLAVHRSNQHIYAQVIDDTVGNTLVAASSLSTVLKEALKEEGGATQEAARQVGVKLAELCLEKGISTVSFDRGGHIYHGRVKAVADAAREGGLVF
ncbi:hypothetical protein WJX84_002551 [Apatococcus fuscideae]|uniref:Large ribosomal subunit protein uL18c n=1 Tax=Apatococcus fuscideae TaxID=2026836 RepID=A0AAW1T845_9CHLO